MKLLKSASGLGFAMAACTLATSNMPVALICFGLSMFILFRG